MKVKDIIKGDSIDFLFFWGYCEKQEKVTKACLSRWYPSRLEVDGVQYVFTEQFMMAEKVRVKGDVRTRMEILQCTDPSNIKVLGRKEANFSEDLAQTMLDAKTTKMERRELTWSRTYGGKGTFEKVICN